MITTDAKAMSWKIVRLLCICFVSKYHSMDYLFIMDNSNFHYFTSVISLTITQPDITYPLMSSDVKFIAPPLTGFAKEYLT